MDKICIFGGTTEGRRLCELLADRAEVTACVATEYGADALDDIKGVAVRTGRMDAGIMADFLMNGGFDRVIDATHPYADKATENIAAAAQKAAIPYMRILREEDRRVEGAVYVSSVKEARDCLSSRGGNILITTGAKELADYAGLDMTRVWARVLPLTSSLEACEKAGVPTAHIIAAQGPFTYESNLALLRDIGARFLVTKDSGRNGGFDEKIAAAMDAGAVPVIIGQPPQIRGLSMDEAVTQLIGDDALIKRRIDIVGLGTGSPELMTGSARAALISCDAVFGARPVIAMLDTKKPCYPEYQPKSVRKILDERPSIRRAAVFMRGDTGFFSGANKIIEEFKDREINVIPGISSVSLFAARLGIGYGDAACISLHGRRANVIRTVADNKKTFILCGGENTATAICRRLCGFGLGGLSAAVGERLSYPEEKLTRARVDEIAGLDTDALAVLYVENPSAEKRLRIGMADDGFIRGSVPMTKAEARAISLAKLSPSADSVIWDVGAGTGSVSVECALAAPDGRVYAVEKDPEAVELIRENRKRFFADNIEVVEGEAPGALADLPSPTHVFIGGSSGRLREIIVAAVQKNPAARIVVNTVTMESAAEAFECMNSFEYTDVVQTSVSRAHSVGGYHMMNAMNPVTVFTMQGAREDD